MTVTDSLTGSPPTLSDTATDEESSRSARRRSSSAWLSLAFGSCSGIEASASIVALNNYPEPRSCPRAGFLDTLHSMRLLYKLLAKITGAFASRIGKTAFKSVWSRIDQEDPPKP